jgi:hypothetical protein
MLCQITGSLSWPPWPSWVSPRWQRLPRPRRGRRSRRPAPTLCVELLGTAAGVPLVVVNGGPGFDHTYEHAAMPGTTSAWETLARARRVVCRLLSPKRSRTAGTSRDEPGAVTG